MLPEPMTPPWKDRAWLILSAVVPAVMAAAATDPYASGDRDAAVVRTVGLGYTGGFHALDAWVAALFAGLPVGTRVLRAELPGVFLLGVTAALAFLLIRRGLVALAGASAWASTVAALATATISLSYPFQHEAVSPGSSLLGVVLVLVALTAESSPPLDAGLVALSLSYDLLVGVCTVAAVALRRLTRKPNPSSGTVARSLSSGLLPALGVALGLVPFVLAAVHARVTSLSTSARVFAAPFGSISKSQGLRHGAAAVLSELGEAMVVLTAVGLLCALWSRTSRPRMIPVAAVGAVGALAFLEVGGGARDAWSPAGLLVLIVATAFAACAMLEAVLRVARARLPLAGASAAMVVVLLCAFPAVAVDDGLARTSTRPLHALASWEDAAFAGLPGGTLVLVSSPDLYARLLATRASGGLPGDLRVVPTFDAANEASAAALAHDARLVPLFRDMALTGVPQELSMSTLASQRPLAVAADAVWDRSLTRHLIPGGLLMIFEPEPRGGSDRKRALEDSDGWRTRLAANAGPDKDDALASLTAAVLFERALSAAATGEKEVALHAIQDASRFAPRDPRIQELALREVSSRGAIDVRDLARQGLHAP
jgi:hypothetical protein